MTDQTQIDRICIATLRSLSIDAVENPHSGHSGTPVSAAATAYCVWQYFDLWLERYAGISGGSSACAVLRCIAPSKIAAEHFGFDPARVIAAAK
jgi:hypothetical protein